jgi:NAD+ synthase
MHIRSSEIVDWLRDRLTAAGARGFAVGLSGGLDSAVVARLCQLAAPDRVIGVMLPCHSDPRDESDARAAADHFSIPAVRVELSDLYDRLTAELRTALSHLPGHHLPRRHEETDQLARVPLANIKPRLRMTSLYFVANSLNYLVAGTGNRCELTVGYFTKHGDGAADVLPLGDLLKSEVRELARDLGVPDSLVAKAPSAGLWVGQTDEDEMGFTYQQLERYLAGGPEAVPPALALRIERLVRQTAHKRRLAPTPATTDATPELFD